MQPNQLSFRPGFWSPSGDRPRVRCVNKLSPTAAAPREASENFRRQPMQILSERERLAQSYPWLGTESETAIIPGRSGRWEGSTVATARCEDRASGREHAGPSSMSGERDAIRRVFTALMAVISAPASDGSKPDLRGGAVRRRQTCQICFRPPVDAAAESRAGDAGHQEALDAFSRSRTLMNGVGNGI